MFELVSLEKENVDLALLEVLTYNSAQRLAVGSDVKEAYRVRH